MGLGRSVCWGWLWGWELEGGRGIGSSFPPSHQEGGTRPWDQPVWWWLVDIAVTKCDPFPVLSGNTCGVASWTFGPERRAVVGVGSRLDKPLPLWQLALVAVVTKCEPTSTTALLSGPNVQVATTENWKGVTFCDSNIQRADCHHSPFPRAKCPRRHPTSVAT